MGNSLAVSVISQVVQSSRAELMALKKRAMRGHRSTVDREAWEAACAASSIDESDRDIFERLFTLCVSRVSHGMTSPFRVTLALLASS